jgi:hypothetical protein
MEHWVGGNPLAAVADLDAPRDGARRIDPRPGLGIAVDETTVRALAG